MTRSPNREVGKGNSGVRSGIYAGVGEEEQPGVMAGVCSELWGMEDR